MDSGLRRKDMADGWVRWPGLDANAPQLIPLPKSCSILRPSLRMGGLQANSGGVSRVGVLPLPQVRVRPQPGERPLARIPHRSKNRHSEAASVSCFYLLRGESRLGVRSAVTDR